MEYVIAAVTLSALPFVGLAVGASIAVIFQLHHGSHRH